MVSSSRAACSTSSVLRSSVWWWKRCANITRRWFFPIGSTQACASAVTVAWAAACVWYIETQIGWDALLSFNPQDIASPLISVLVLPSLLWGVALGRCFVGGLNQEMKQYLGPLAETANDGASRVR